MSFKFIFQKFYFFLGGELPDNFENTSSSTNDGKTLQQQPHIQLPSNLDSQLLPDSLPAAGARPVFLTEPEDSYVIKSRPAELSCKVKKVSAFSEHFRNHFPVWL